jgi:hypothetical protein
MIVVRRTSAIAGTEKLLRPRQHDTAKRQLRRGLPVAAGRGDRMLQQVDLAGTQLHPERSVSSSPTAGTMNANGSVPDDLVVAVPASHSNVAIPSVVRIRVIPGS